MIDALEAFEEWVGQHIYQPVMCKLFGHKPYEVGGYFIHCFRCSKRLT